MAGMVAGMASLTIGGGSSSTRTRGPPRESDASDNSDSKGNKSAPLKVSGTRGSFNVKGNGSIIVVENGTINSGYCAGNGKVSKLAVPNDDCNGTDDAYNVEEGGKICVIRGSLNSGAFSGNSAQN